MKIIGYINSVRVLNWGRQWQWDHPGMDCLDTNDYIDIIVACEPLFRQRATSQMKIWRSRNLIPF